MIRFIKHVLAFFKEPANSGTENKNLVVTYGDYYYEAICPSCE